VDRRTVELVQLEKEAGMREDKGAIPVMQNSTSMAVSPLI